MRKTLKATVTVDNRRITLEGPRTSFAPKFGGSSHLTETVTKTLPPVNQTGSRLLNGI